MQAPERVALTLDGLGFAVRYDAQGEVLPTYRGIDLSNRNREFFLDAPWLMLAPGIALSLSLLGFNFLGDALRDILDPRLHG